MKKYLNNFLYIIEHKKNVFQECWKEKLYYQAFFHDISKFRPSEFIPFSRFLYGEKTEKNRVAFSEAVKLHYARNQHHPEYWNGSQMTHDSIKEFICDLKAMSKKFGGTAQTYYLMNYKKWDLHYDSRLIVEYELCLNPSMAYNYGHTLEDFANKYSEDEYNNYFMHIEYNWGINSYKLFKEMRKHDNRK